ncbi:MAG: hypothetical protein HHAS10_07660 [Candidatus Altimarinota bacterium]
MLPVVLVIPLQLFATETITKEATYYSDSFQGGHTANGDTFDQNSYSAAMCDIPLGQYLHVSKGNTGVVVELNDRPNCSRYPEVIDLSRRAFQVFAPLSAGRVEALNVTPIGTAPMGQTKGFLPSDSFRHLGVTLTNDIPNILFSGDTIEVSGNITTANQYVLVYAQKEGNPPVNKLLKVGKDKTFKGYITLPDITGELVFVVASGNSFDTDKYVTLTLIGKDSLSYPNIPSSSRVKISPKLTYSPNGEPLIRLPKNIYAELKITQDKRMFQTQGNSLLLSNLPLSVGKAQVSINGFGLSSSSPLDRGISYPSLFSGSILLERSHDTIGGDLVSIQNRNTFAKFRFKSPTDYKLRSKYYILSPNGDVKEMAFPKSYIGDDGFLRSGFLVSSVFRLDGEGTYLLEIVREDGIAFANISVTKGNAWPVVEMLSDKQISQIRDDRAQVIVSTVNRINDLRKNLGRNSVSLDDTLTKLAQAKVDDMIRRGYEGHADPDGNYIDYLALKLGINPGGAIGENIGYGTVSDLSLEDGLEESGVHRMNILQDAWNRVGIGYGVNEGKVYLVHIFGE